MNCNMCGATISEEALFCPKCGAKQEKLPEININLCPKCGADVPDDALFCPECGSRLDESAKEQAVTEQVVTEQAVTEQAVTEQLGAEQAAAEQPVYQQAYQQPYQQPAKKNNLPIIIGAVLGGIVVLGIFIAILFTMFGGGINLNKYMKVTYEGYNTVGKAYAYFDSDAFREDYQDKFEKNNKSINAFISDVCVGQLDKSTGLSNGDTVTFKWMCDDNLAKNNYGVKIKYSDIECKIKDLKEAETFNPFDGVEVVYTGISPDGRVEYNANPTIDAAKDLTYSFDVQSGLKNGDVITLTVSAYGEDPVEYCINNYGMIPSPLEQQYTVDGLDEYVYSSDKLSEEVITDMSNQGLDMYRAKTANFGDTEKLDSLKYIGYYLLTSKTSDNYGMKNAVYCVYKIKVKNSYSNGGSKYSKTNTIYWYVGFRDVMVKPDGSCSFDLSNRVDCYDRYTIDSEVSSGWFSTFKWYYDGYASMDELYNKAVVANMAEYNYEDKTTEDGVESKDSEKDDSKDSEASAEEGIIFPDSSKRALSDSEIKALTDEQLQSAINEICARHGYIFNSKKLRDFYSKYDWYEQKVKPKDFDESCFNEFEHANFKKLQEERNSRK